MTTSRIQFLIDDAAVDILNQLSRRSDKARFVQYAIQYCYENSPEAKKLFSWSNNTPNNEPQIKQNTTSVDNNHNNQISIDDDFN